MAGAAATPRVRARRPSPSAAADAMLALGPQTAVVKLGADGALARTRIDGGARATVRAPRSARSDVADPVGAGDAFCAGFIAATLRDDGLPEALRVANACGASVVRQRGGPRRPADARGARSTADWRRPRHAALRAAPPSSARRGARRRVHGRSPGQPRQLVEQAIQRGRLASRRGLAPDRAAARSRRRRADRRWRLAERSSRSSEGVSKASSGRMAR